jgi:hypothetical protein
MNENEIVNEVVILAVSTLAGFNWEWTMDQFNRVKERF